MPRPMVNDIAAPPPPDLAPPAAAALRPLAEPLHRSAAPVPTPAVVQSQPPALTSAPANQAFTTNLVTNIPIHDPQQSTPAKEDDELDKIMKDVGHELKKDVPVKKAGHFSLFSRKRRTAAPVSVRPTAAPPSAPVHPVSAPTTQPAATSHPVKPTAAVKPKQHTTAPVMVIMVTVLVTGLLMAAAVYTYK